MIQENAEQEPEKIADATILSNRALIAQFEQGRAPNGFHHADHVRVAFAYVSEFPLPEAIAKFSSALRRFALAQGKSNLYHETITWAYLFLIAERIQRGQPGPWDEFALRNTDLLVSKGGILERYYTKAALDSDIARRIFILPDRVSEPRTIRVL
jgi:hypothetical protein